MSNLTYAITTTSSSVASDSNIPLTTLARKSKCSNIGLINNALVFTAPGYYRISGTVTFTAEAGIFTLNVLKNGSAVPGITASLTTVADTTYTIPINGIIRVYCGEQPTTILLQNAGVAITITNVSIETEYLQ